MNDLQVNVLYNPIKYFKSKESKSNLHKTIFIVGVFFVQKVYTVSLPSLLV